MFEEPCEGRTYSAAEMEQMLYDLARIDPADEPEWKQEYIKPDRGKKCKNKPTQVKRIYRVQKR
jgi:hypothetical protein